MISFYHEPVLKNEVLEALQVNQSSKRFVDCTLGGGGHSKAILESLSNDGELIAFDRDTNAIAHAMSVLSDFSNKKIIHTDFASGICGLESLSVFGILADLGISSRQVDDGERGFSFRNSEFLDLRMDLSKDLNAGRWIEESSLDEIALAMKKNADLHKSYRIATLLKSLVEEYKLDLPMAPLLESLEKMFPEKRRDISGIFARVIQAIRMEVNQELDQITKLIHESDRVLEPGGRICFLTYHSVEDRRVKQGMQVFTEGEKVNKRLPVRPENIIGPRFIRLGKFVLPTEAEVSGNPRARSAKMRVYQKV
jgi:16S rRNA (cytosine1402-N4)-methyltransferase